MKTPFLNKTVIFLIVGLRPLFGTAHCRYAVSCTKFATWQLQENALLPAMWEIIKRVCLCNPFNSIFTHKNRSSCVSDEALCVVGSLSKDMNAKRVSL